MTDINKDPSQRELKWFGLLLAGFAGGLGGLVLWKGQALLGMAVFLATAWLISVIFNIRDLKTQWLGVLLPALCAAMGGPVKAGVEPMVVAAMAWGTGALTAAAVLASPRVGRTVYVGMAMAAVPIGWTITHLALAVTYYLVLCPVGLIMRLSGRDPMQRRFDRSATSYWTELDPGPNVGRYFRQF